MATYTGTNANETYVNINQTDVNDTINMGGGNDNIYQGIKEDVGVGSSEYDFSNDLLNGGAGFDSVIYKNPLELEPSDPDLISSFEITFPITGFIAGSQLLAVGKGVDDITAGFGLDTLVDIERIVAQDPDTVVPTSFNTNTIDATLADIGVQLNLTTLQLQVGANGYEVVNFVDFKGSEFADTAIGDSRDNTFYGNGGDDELSGGEGNDTLIGGTGTNTLRGDDGEDILRGGYSTSFNFNYMYGGNDNDIFAVGANQGFAVIKDFRQLGDDDKIGLDGLTLDDIVQFQSPFNPGSLFIGQLDNSTIPGTLIYLAQLENYTTPLTETDFVFL